MASHVDALQTAVGLHQAGQLSQAEQIYRQILDAFPSHPDALHLIGLAALQSGRYELAIQYIGQAINARPAQPIFYNSLGEAYRTLGNMDVAQQLYEKAIALAPDHALVHNNLGKALRAQGKLAESVSEFRSALACQEDLAEARSNLGAALVALERFDEAIEHLAEAVRRHGQSPEAHMLLGCAYSASKNWEPAIRCFHEALRLAPEYVEARCNLASALRLKGDTGAALTLLEETVARHPNHATALLAYADLLESQDRVAESLECCERAVRSQPRFVAAHLQRARVLERLQRFDDAREAMGEATRLQQAAATPGADAQILCLNASHEHRCLFIHVPKNGGTSIKKALDMPGAAHRTWESYATRYPRVWQQYASFAVVRNPWDRAVSAYHHARMKESHWHNERLGMHLDYRLLHNRSFEECVTILCKERPRLQHDSWLDQAHFVADVKSPDRKIMVGTLLRFETLADDFARFCREKGIRCEPLPTVNTSQRSRDYREYYNDRTRQMVAEVYRADIEAFGYSF
jgi:tetratricopeptide (TPR) repeat protein